MSNCSQPRRLKWPDVVAKRVRLLTAALAVGWVVAVSGRSGPSAGLQDRHCRGASWSAVARPMSNCSQPRRLRCRVTVSFQDRVPHPVSHESSLGLGVYKAVSQSTDIRYSFTESVYCRAPCSDPSYICFCIQSPNCTHVTPIRGLPISAHRHARIESSNTKTRVLL